MHQIAQIIDNHPDGVSLDSDRIYECIQACLECSASCTACAESCLSRDHVDLMRQCIRRNQDCADMCTTTGAMVLRHTSDDTIVLEAQLRACAEICRLCGDECATHADKHTSCRICAELCRRCEATCHALLETVGTQV